MVTLLSIGVEGSLTDGLLYYYPMETTLCLDNSKIDTVFFQIWDYRFNNKNICMYYFDYRQENGSEELNEFNELVNDVTDLNCSFQLSKECVEELYNNGSGKEYKKGDL